MLVMTYSEAEANFATLLNKVEAYGAAIVKRSDGSSFRITMEESEKKSPFASITSVANLPLEEIMDIFHASRERT